MNRIMISLGALLGGALPLLIDSTLKGAALLLLAGLAALALSKASAATRHLVWLFAIGALLVLPVLSALLPGWRVLPHWTAVAAPAVSSVNTTARPRLPAFQSPVETPTVPFTGPAFALPRIKPEEAMTLREWLPLAWAAGFSLLLLRLLAAHCLLSRAARRWTPATDARIIAEMESARKQLNVGQPVQVFLDSRRTIPMVWGLSRPRLVLPAEAVDWADSQLRSVLLHELAHIKRGDLAVQWLMQAACALHWFNPLVWFAAWRLHVEGERACDNLVLASGVRASDYAEHVLHVATKLIPSPGVDAASLAMARPSRLEGRLLAVLNERLNRRGVTRALMWAALALGLCVTIPVAMLRAKAENGGAENSNSALAPVVVGQLEAQNDNPPNPGTGKPLQLAQDDAVPSPPAKGVTVGIASNGSYSLEGKAMTLEALTKELKKLQEKNPNLRAAIRAAPDVAYANIIPVLDALDQAGVDSISLVTRKDDSAEGSRIRLRQAEGELKRASALRRNNLISEAEFEKAQYDVEQRRAALAAAEADYRRATERYGQFNTFGQSLKTVPSAAKAGPLDIEVARAELEVAKADLSIARANLKHISDLADQKLVTQPQLEVAKAEVAKAEAKYRLAEAQYEQLATLKQAAPQKAPANSQKNEKLLDILAAEIQVAEAQAKIAHDQRKVGTATLETCLRADLEVLALRRERANLEGDTAKARDVIEAQVHILQELERSTNDQMKQGTASEADVLIIRRQILLLQRQQAELE